MQSESKPFNVNIFHRALGTVLTNSKDWEGHRQLRKKIIIDLDVPVLNPNDIQLPDQEELQFE